MIRCWNIVLVLLSVFPASPAEHVVQLRAGNGPLSSDCSATSRSEVFVSCSGSICPAGMAECPYTRCG